MESHFNSLALRHMPSSLREFDSKRTGKFLMHSANSRMNALNLMKDGKMKMENLVVSCERKAKRIVYSGRFYITKCSHIIVFRQFIHCDH